MLAYAHLQVQGLEHERTRMQDGCRFDWWRFPDAVLFKFGAWTGISGRPLSLQVQAAALEAANSCVC